MRAVKQDEARRRCTPRRRSPSPNVSVGDRLAPRRGRGLRVRVGIRRLGALRGNDPSVGLISPNAFTTVVDGGVWTSATCATPTPSSPPPPSPAPSPPPPPPPPLLVASSGAARARRSSSLEPFWTWFAVVVLAWAGLSVCVFGALAARRRRREVVRGRD
ncbi:hypothetical protein NFJ02_16g25010 [Pycnococcus provasolii]